MSDNNNNNTQLGPRDMSQGALEIIHEYILGNSDTKLDLRRPHLRPAMARLYPFIVCMYALLISTGVLLNVGILVHIVRNKLYCGDDPTYSFVVNNAISDIVKCVVVLPLSLFILLVQNWILGELLCSFLPMLQDIPMHTTTLTFLLMAWDRFRLVRNPTKARLPAFVCTVGTWLTSVCLVLPYPIYIIYVDLGLHYPHLHGVGVCVVNLADDMLEYMRGIFLFMYAAPLATISYLYVRVSRELQTHHSSVAVIMFETRRARRFSEGCSRTGSQTTHTDFRSVSRGADNRSSSQFSGESGSRVRYEENYESREELDVAKEKRTQKYLVPMVTLYAIFLCPLMILRLARLALLETYENSGHFDITYTLFVWVAFLPTCSTPVIYCVWQMSRSSKRRLRGYFRFSDRKLRRSCETVITAAGTPAVIPRRGNKRTGRILSNDAHSDNNSFQQDFSSP